MRKSILTLVGSALIAASMAQAASATEHRGRRVERAPAPISDQVRNANASSWYTTPAWVGGSRYENGALAGPSGR
jgi:opacity protein-like surface antigen